ncbi:hypothetical protein TCAL_08696 [Tigriopus californicus]|uniref:tRNA (guanine(26)-N(2))-dimethyltransferase n=1 Tax=Tigriopus californicus TaxID=6832 RepID=A0A553NDN2_TIGCA|nr:hypothetical protein TCAL_08696 [Tigriopus californicus]
MLSGRGIRAQSLLSRALFPFFAGLFGRVSSILPFKAAPIMTDKTAPQVREGQATITFPSAEEVFYNPGICFAFSSVAVIRLYVKQLLAKDPTKAGKVNVMEALSASGLRSIRYAKEIPGLDKIVANDISKKAVETIRRNIINNGVEELVQPSHNDASMAMYLKRKPEDRFQIIDLDPYGSPTPFLDAAVQSTVDGGLLCVTCTDMAVLCGNATETCYTKYGAISLKAKSCHEIALRIVIACVESHANRYGRYIEPILSLSIDFYCRIFFRINTSQAMCKRTTSKLGHLYQCNGCETLSFQPLGQLVPNDNNGKNFKYKLVSGPPVNKHCSHCQNTHQVGGPIWIAPIHDQHFVSELLVSLDNHEYQTVERMKGMLTVAELPDVPLYYQQDRLCAMVKTGSGKMTVFRSALLNAGYRVSLSHANKMAIKTDAPAEFIWDMMRVWRKSNSQSDLKPGTTAFALMATTPKHEVSFETHTEANPDSRKLQLKRFQVNPERNWGPKSRASAGNFDDSEKRRQNQGKKRKQDPADPVAMELAEPRVDPKQIKTVKDQL